MAPLLVRRTKTMYVQRDPFARGQYERTCISNMKDRLSCCWCGQTPRRLYSYRWESDGQRTYYSIVRDKHYCNFQCFKTHNS